MSQRDPLLGFVLLAEGPGGGWAGAVSPALDVPLPAAPSMLPALQCTRGPKRKKKPRPTRQETSNQGQCF